MGGGRGDHGREGGAVVQRAMGKNLGPLDQYTPRAPSTARSVILVHFSERDGRGGGEKVDVAKRQGVVTSTLRTCTFVREDSSTPHAPPPLTDVSNHLLLPLGPQKLPTPPDNSGSLEDVLFDIPFQSTDSTPQSRDPRKGRRRTTRSTLSTLSTKQEHLRRQDAPS